MSWENKNPTQDVGKKSCASSSSECAQMRARSSFGTPFTRTVPPQGTPPAALVGTLACETPPRSATPPSRGSCVAPPTVGSRRVARRRLRRWHSRLNAACGPESLDVERLAVEEAADRSRLNDPGQRQEPALGSTLHEPAVRPRSLVFAVAATAATAPAVVLTFLLLVLLFRSRVSQWPGLVGDRPL